MKDLLDLSARLFRSWDFESTIAADLRFELIVASLSLESEFKGWIDFLDSCYFEAESYL